MDRWMVRGAGVLFLAGVLAAVTTPAQAAEEFSVVIKEHRFEPAELTLPAGLKVKLLIDNQDATPEEFESDDLNREKIIAAKSRGFVFIGPLRPGTYKYFGDFHQDTAQGVITVKES